MAKTRNGISPSDRAIASARTFDHRAVAGAELVLMLICNRVPGGELLIHFDTPAGFFADPRIAILHLGRSMEDVAHQWREVDVLVDAEVLVREIEREIGHAPDRRVGRAVPG